MIFSEKNRKISSVFCPLRGVWVATLPPQVKAHYLEVSSPTGRVGCNYTPSDYQLAVDVSSPTGRVGCNCIHKNIGSRSVCFVPYGACGLQLQAKMHFKKPLIMRLFGHVFAVLCEPITYYSICEQACQYFWHISAFYQRFRIVRIFFMQAPKKYHDTSTPLRCHIRQY